MAIVLSIVVIVLHGLFMSHAGALWRDEADVVQLAMMPTARDILQNFQIGSTPILFPFSLRAYTAIVGDSDFALRVTGDARGNGNHECRLAECKISRSGSSPYFSAATRIQHSLHSMGRFDSRVWHRKRT